jgi:hypothetical protein
MTNRTNPGSKSTDEVQREVRASRAEVEQTLEAIQDRLSPGQLFDQAVAYLSSSGGNEFLRNFGATVRDNPVPVALLGTGLAWLMLAKPRPVRSHDEYEDLLGEYPEEYYGTGTYPAGYYPESAKSDDDVLSKRPPSVETAAEGEQHATPRFAERARETADAARERAQELGASTQHAARDASESAKETAREWGSAARDGARAAAWRARERARRLGADAREQLHDTRDYLRDGARDAQARAGYYGRRMRRSFFDTLHEQPLVLGAVGLAVGAAIGAGLPATETEDEWLGETRDRLKDRAERLGSEQLDKARATARAAYETAQEEADRQGLTMEDAAAAADAIERKAERVAQAAGQAARTEAERQKLGQTGSEPT